MKRQELIVLDLDGTLVDSVPDLAFAVREMLRRTGRETASSEQVRSWVGNGMNMLVRRALAGKMEPDSDPPDFDEACGIFSEVYAENLSVRSALYPGVLEGLELLGQHGYVLACVTNKHSMFTQTLLERLGLDRFFDAIVCGDTYEKRKPHPMPLLKTAERFNIKPGKSTMVGDSINDIGAGRAAGFRCVAVPYGYPGPSTIEELGADHVIDSIADLPALLTSGV